LLVLPGQQQKSILVTFHSQNLAGLSLSVFGLAVFVQAKTSIKQRKVSVFVVMQK
jgi:hypothetical protein